jgi:hypothetical protein
MKISYYNIPMTLKLNKQENYYTINNIIIGIEDGLKINKLKNLKEDSFVFEDNIWYYNNYKSKNRLIDILYPDNKILSFEFKNNDYNDYRQSNLVLHYDSRFSSEIKKLPPNISIYKDNKDNKEYLSFSKVINKKRYSYKTKLKSENIDEELPSFIENVNKKYPELNILL